MNTSIWSANLIFGSDSNQVILEKEAIKRIPVHLLLSDTNFIKRIQKKVGEKAWNKLPKDSITNLPNMKVFYLKFLGHVAMEPIIE